MDNNSPIGIFDSGVGGLTVLKEIFRVLPNEATIYLGDTARVPYGIRSPDTVTRYSFENTEFLVKKSIKLLVIACNTASSISLEAIKNHFSIPVIGVIEPGAKAALGSTKTNRIGIIGTEGTIKSNSYINSINAIRNKGTVAVKIKDHGTKYLDRYFKIEADGMVIFTKACPLFVSLAEEGWTTNDVARLTVKHYLSGLKKENIDTLVLGCTHYPLLKESIAEVMGDDVSLIDSATETVKEIKKMLSVLKLESKSDKIQRQFYVTDSPERFLLIGERFLGQKIEHIEKIAVGI
ncbi:MAG: glutamate racemase [Nitrospirae bacterium]|nr:glutamate racemase [Nitrospirota bacterium]